MKLHAALLVLAIAPALASANPASADPQFDPSQTQTVSRASSHDRHHSRHTHKVHHRHRKVSKHHSTTQQP
jgi:hypothetical protein